MTHIVLCGVIKSNGLSSTINEQGKIICTNCGTEIDDKYNRDTQTHVFHDFIGAFCKKHKAIHYRWINKDWSLEENPPLKKRAPKEPLILPKLTENGLEKYFIKQFYWKSNNDCLAPGYREVLWTDFDDSRLVLLRPADTGYLKVNSHGMHAPFIAALIEWLLKKDEWTDLAELIKHSLLPKREKRILSLAVSSPTPSNIFKMLWTFKRFLPGWNNKRSLGKRSPSMLIQDEIRWTTNRLEGMTDPDRERLIKYGPEPEYWGSWPELWPEDKELGTNLNEFGPELKLLGIDYGDTLDLIYEPNIRQGERSWVEIADKLIHWPINMNKGGSVNLNRSLRKERGFISNLKNHVSVAIDETETNAGKWTNYLKVNMPLSWILIEENDRIVYQANPDVISVEELHQTLNIVSPWIRRETDLDLLLMFSKPINGQLEPRIKSFQIRLRNSSVELNYSLANTD